MNLTIELTDEQAEALKTQAASRGWTVERWLQHLAEQHVSRPAIAHLQKTNPKEWAREFHAWAASHNPNTPVLSDEAMSRESIYPDQA